MYLYMYIHTELYNLAASIILRILRDPVVCVVQFGWMLLLWLEAALNQAGSAGKPADAKDRAEAIDSGTVGIPSTFLEQFGLVKTFLDKTR